MNRWDEDFDLPPMPDAEQGPWRVENFTITEREIRGIENMRLSMSRRGVKAGDYTRLIHQSMGVMMSDTPAERRDHSTYLYAVQRPWCKRVLIHGLGLGMATVAALKQPHVEHVDVVEIDNDVIDLVKPHIKHEKLTIINADALTHRWPKDTRWDVAWHDIWLGICSDNVPEMSTFKRRFARKTHWQGCWGEGLLRRVSTPYPPERIANE